MEAASYYSALQQFLLISDPFEKSKEIHKVHGCSILLRSGHRRESTAGHHNARNVVQWEPGEGLGGKAEGSHPTIGHAVRSALTQDFAAEADATCHLLSL